MKKIGLIICVLISFYSCRKNSFVDPTILPEATTSGAGTFGCLIDGWVYTGGRYSDYWDWVSAEEQPSINFCYYKAKDSMVVRVKTGEGEYLKFSIHNIVSNLKPQTCQLRHARFEPNAQASTDGIIPLDSLGEVYITELNDSLHIISGTFRGIGTNPRIKEGRFDVVYRTAQ
ncbi:MAG: hypothetical protein LBR36_02925 [Bacteroidales bacterium]|jgi:hypothetical protein|nr:hypothetical protein [Bacteroidales bacterium]